jgi:predicted PurR-regulated permease PerM
MPVASPSLPEYARRVVATIALVALALFLWKIAPVLMLAFAGIVFAGAVRAASSPLTRYARVPDAWAVAIVFLVFLVFVVGGGYAFGKTITTQTTELWDAIKDAATKVQEVMESSTMGAWVLEQARGGTDPEAMGKVFKGTVTVFGGVADVILVLFLALYFAVDPRTYRDGFLLLLPKGAREKAGDALDASGVALRRWLLGQLGAMSVVGLLTGLGLWAVGVPLAIPLGILSGLLDFVPLVGPLIAAIPGLLIAFAQGPEVALYAAIVYLAAQFVEGHLVLPIAQKWAVKLPPVLGLLAIVAFGLVFGFIGVLFAMPLTVVALVLVDRLWVKRLDPGAHEDEEPDRMPTHGRRRAARS